MFIEQKSLLSKAVALGALLITISRAHSILRYSAINEDWGYAKNCGTRKANFSFSWTPRVLSARHDITIKLWNYTTPYVLGGGSFNVTLRQAKEKTPFLAYANLFTCDDVLDIIPCPFAPHFPVPQTKYIIRTTEYLLSFPGKYVLTIDIKNEKGKQMFCAELNITIQNYPNELP